MKTKRIISLILTLALSLSAFCVTAFAEDEPKNLGDGYRVFIDGELWSLNVVESMSDTVSLRDLNITVALPDGDELAPEEYTLTVERELYWDEENEVSVTEPVDGDLKVYEGTDGFSTYLIKAEGVGSAGTTGTTEPTYLDLFHKYSFNYFGCTVSFGDDYRSDSTWFWHDYYRIPKLEVRLPVVRDVSGEEVDPENYTITYYQRNTEPVDFDDEEYEDKVYPRENPMDEMPTEVGAYYAVIQGNAPYYGTGHVDFDIVAPESYAQSVIYTAYDGETLYVPVDGEIYVKFDLEPYIGLIPGWRNDLFKETGFGIDDDPTFFEDDDYAYAHIYANGKQVGEKATLYYNWYRPEDIFGEDAPGWIDAVPVMGASVVIEVAEKPRPFAFIKDDETRYYDGDTIWLNEGDEILLCFDLTWQDDFLLTDRDLSDLIEKGFTVDEELIQFEEAGYVYQRITADGVKPGTVAEVTYQSYKFNDYFSEDRSDKPSFYPGTVKIGVPQSTILGDADGSGDVTILDATAIQRYLANLPNEAFDEKAADADGIGGVTILDATAIQRWLAGFDDGYAIAEQLSSFA